MRQEQKEKVFTEMIGEYKDKIFRLCYANLYNKADADDLFQEVMYNVWNNIEKYRNESSLSTWVYRITVNTALLFNKRNTRKNRIFRSKDTQELDQYTFQSDVSSTKGGEELEQLYKFIDTLKPQDKLIVTLLLEGISYEEIGEVVGISSNYVGVKINRIKSALAKLFREEQ